MKFPRLLCKLLAIFGFLITASCFGSFGKNFDNRDRDLYDNVGYSPGFSPSEIDQKSRKAKLANSGVKIVPDYYYRAPARVPVKKRVVRPQRSLSVQYKPSSRYYNNPYSFKPPLNFPYFDSDQYYVPPKGYDSKRRNPDSSKSQNDSKNSQLY